MTATPREPRSDAFARRPGKRHTTTPAITSDSDDDLPVVRWPEPSRLESWWHAIMHPTAEPPTST